VTPTITLRPWQRAALDAFAASQGSDFLAVATPGAGKTTFALTAARQVLAAASPDDARRRLIVVVPTAHLKAQWARAALAFDLHLDPQWAAADGVLPPDMHGVVTTYQQVASSAPVLRGLATNAFVIFDELHHAADDRAWGDSVRTAFERAARRLALSGTPFRSDVHAIPFVRYDADEAVPDYEYNYGDALRDGGVVRPVYFPRIDRMMEWSAPDGSLHAHSFEDPLDAARASQRLRAATRSAGTTAPRASRRRRSPRSCSPRKGNSSHSSPRSQRCPSATAAPRTGPSTRTASRSRKRTRR
jgi:superfamily II DNA or RNA helicase